MGKVKVSKEVFEALESFKKRKGEHFKKYLNYNVCTNVDLLENEKILRYVDFGTLVDIAYCGYELEKTSEEEILELYKLAKIKRIFNIEYNYGYIDGIKMTLDKLNIKIEGIN